MKVSCRHVVVETLPKDQMRYVFSISWLLKNCRIEITELARKPTITPMISTEIISLTRVATTEITSRIISEPRQEAMMIPQVFAPRAREESPGKSTEAMV